MNNRLRLMEDQERILRRTREFLRENSSKGKTLTRKSKDVVRESEGSDRVTSTELQKIKWTLKNKLLPMIQKMTELESDLKWLESSEFGKWEIPEKKLGEKKVNRVTSNRSPITEKDTPKLSRVEKFKTQWDDLRKDLYYPSGRNRGIEDHTHTYTWNQLGTPQSQKELLQRMKKKRPPMSGMWYDTWMLKELPDEGKTLVINKWGFDSSD